MKYFFTGFLFLGSFTFVTAQGQMSLGLEGAVPNGPGSGGVNNGYGIWIKYERQINDYFTWQASVGYVYFSVKDPYGYVHFDFVPILAGAKYYLMESLKGPYLGSEVG